MRSADLRGVVRGAVLAPGDDGFEQAARPWNVAVPQPVAAVVAAADADDVAAVVTYARRVGRPVVTQPTGHGATGGIEDAILLRTGRLDSVEIDAKRRRASVGAGAQWGKVQAAVSKHELTGLAGSNPVVGVTGYTLGGGVGWFSRKYGWASDAVRAFDIVDADGRPTRITEGSDADLFWALRGGGGDFAVVTGIEFDLHPVARVYGGRMMWSGARTHEVYEAFRELTADAPAELSLWFHRFQFPDAPPMVAVDAAFLGEHEEGRALLARLDALGDPIEDKRGMLSTADIGDITTEPTAPSPSISYCELLTELGDTVTAALLDEPVAPLLDIQIRHLGGALAERRANGGARGPIAEPYAMYALGLGLPQIADAVRAKITQLGNALDEYTGSAKPYTFLAVGETAAAAFDDATLARLRAIKRDRDPHNVIRANFPILG